MLATCTMPARGSYHVRTGVIVLESNGELGKRILAAPQFVEGRSFVIGQLVSDFRSEMTLALLSNYAMPLPPLV